MNESMNLIFETHDLSEASPATVSRCGMVYMAQEAFGGWKTLLDCWMNQFEQDIELDTMQISGGPENVRWRIKTLFKYVYPELIERVLRKCSFSLQVSETQLAASTLKILSIMMKKREFI